MSAPRAGVETATKLQTIANVSYRRYLSAVRQIRDQFIARARPLTEEVGVEESGLNFLHTAEITPAK